MSKCLDYSNKFEHVMEFTKIRALNSMFSILNQHIRNILNYNQYHDFKLNDYQINKYLSKSILIAIIWSFSGDCHLKYKIDLCNYIKQITKINLPNDQMCLFDYTIDLETGEWTSWLKLVHKIDIEPQKIIAINLIIPTIDTVRHEYLLNAWLNEHKPCLLCGPPGSGKTMNLLAYLRSSPDLEVVSINFSSTTTPDVILKALTQYCEYKKISNQIVLAPYQLSKWLVLFCDEINLPAQDKYETQQVISFMRQCIEQNGFYKGKDWIKLERIQFVGACNPPTDLGRKVMSNRFLRHASILYIDYPTEMSLKQIYSTLNRAILRKFPNIRVYSESMTNAMIEFYLLSQERFTTKQQPHYIYSPRELTRWVRGIYEAIKLFDKIDNIEYFIRLFAYEAIRIFHDRLVTEEERKWTIDNIDLISIKNFSNFNADLALNKPILFSNWINKEYVSVNQQDLKDYIKARLKVFYEEEQEISLILYDEALDQVLRIDRIYKQPHGHLLLIGASGVGKKSLSRFVAWINNMSVFQIRFHTMYTAKDFDQDLKNLLRRVGVNSEKIVFILNDLNTLDSSFLERMNILLTNGEIPGLFEGDEFSTLISQCKESAHKIGLMLNSSEEIYKWFTNEIIHNLHVVFTINSVQFEFKDRIVTSPALFNRCVLNWFGDWSSTAYHQITKELTIKIDLDNREHIINAFLEIHNTLHEISLKLIRNRITPRHYIDFINHFIKIYNEKRTDLEQQQLHLNIGLAKINETVNQVEELQAVLIVKKNELETKNLEASQKLKQLINDQQETQNKKIVSQELKLILNQQSETIVDKERAVNYDLSQAESIIIEAKKSNKNYFYKINFRF